MAKLTPAEIATIKDLLERDGELPRSFHHLLFPPEQPSAQMPVSHVERVKAYLSDVLAQQRTNDQNEVVNVAVLVQGDEIHMWLVPRLWTLAQSLRVEAVPVHDLLVHFETAHWFADDEPKVVRVVVEHARRMMDTDLSYPIILAADGQILDGFHRIGKAYITGLETIGAVRFTTNPAPDFRIPLEP